VHVEVQSCEIFPTIFKKLVNGSPWAPLTCLAIEKAEEEAVLQSGLFRVLKYTLEK
jgi:hypothetical protein